jgi:UDP-glucose 4-epimerase
MSRICITGARGFIGQHLVRHLAAADCDVAGIGHGAWPQHEAGAPEIGAWINGDVNAANLDILARSGAALSAIIHLAGGSSVAPSIAAPHEDFQRSVVSTAQLMEWVRTRSPATKVVLVSSAAVYGASDHAGPMAETATLAPASPYGVHKLAAERIVQMYASQFGCHAAIARMFSVYGPGLKKQLLWDLSTRCARGENPLTLHGSGQELRDWLHVNDACKFITLLMTAADSSCPVVNGGTGIATPVRDIAGIVARQWPHPPEIGFSGQRRAGDPDMLVADVTKARSMGFAACETVDTGIAAFAAWFQSQATGR